MKIAHLSDLHYRSKDLETIDEATAYAVDDAIAAGAEAAILSGDAFDTACHVHDPAVHRLLGRIQRLADAMPVLILQGTYSHDRLGSLELFRTLGSRHPIHVAERIEQVALADGRWQPAEGAAMAPPATARLLVSCLPSINRGAVAAAAGVDQAGTAAAELVHQVCRGWAVTNAQARAQGVPTVLTAHGTVQGSLTESRHALVSPDHEFSPGALFDADAAAGMLGHIHQHQAWERDGRRLAYPGSITRLIYGHHAATGYLLWTVDAAGAAFELRPTPAPALVELAFDGAPDLDELRARAAEAEGAHVRVRYQVPEAERESVDHDAVREVLADAAAVKIEPRVLPAQRARAEGLSRAATPAAMLQRWAEATGHEPGPLLERLQRLEHETPEAIVEAIAGTGETHEPKEAT